MKPIFLALVASIFLPALGRAAAEVPNNVTESTYDLSGDSCYYCLPAYNMMGENPDVRKVLDLSAQQADLLRKISDKFYAELTEEIRRPQPGLPSNNGETNMHFEKRLGDYSDRQKSAAAQQIERILTPRQLDAYKKLAFPMIAHRLTHKPGLLKAIGATPQEKQRLARLDQQWRHQAWRNSQDRAKAVLNVLTPDQQNTLRAEALQSDREATDEPDVPNGAISYEASFRLPVGWGAPSPTPTAPEELPLAFPLFASIYRNLTKSEVRAALGVSAIQESNLRRVLEKCVEQEPAIPSTSATRKMNRELRLQVDGILTAQQRKAVAEIAFETYASTVMMDQDVQRKLAVSDAQKERLNVVMPEWSKKDKDLSRSMIEQSVAALDPKTQKRVHEEIDRLGKW